MSIKTIVIWDVLSEGPIQFFVLDGDYQYLDGTYLNSSEWVNKQQQLDDLMYVDSTTSGEMRVELKDEFPFNIFAENQLKNIRVIRCGFLP